MDAINLVIFENSNVWDVISFTSRKCYSCDNAFVHFKRSLKMKFFGTNLVIRECCHRNCHCKYLLRNSKCISLVEDSDLVTFANTKIQSWKCVNQVSEEIYNNQSAFMRMNGYELSVICIYLISSIVFRKKVIRNVKSLANLRSRKTITVIVELVPPVRDILDYAWGRRMERLAYERMELNTSMSWLSTLGGAFSALGEEKVTCAGIAGRISVHQFKIALRLGDLLTVSRCKLYLALSLMQRGRLKSAKNIIYEEYTLAKVMPEEAKDTRLIRMCQGLWAKLKYAYKLKRRNRLEGTHSNIEPLR